MSSLVGHYASTSPRLAAKGPAGVLSEGTKKAGPGGTGATGRASMTTSTKRPGGK